MKKLFFLLALPLLLQSCVSVQSNRTAATPSLKKVLVFVENPGNATSLAKTIGEKLMAGREILYTGHDLASLEPAETLLQKNVASFQPDAILTINYKGSETHHLGENGYTNYTYVAEMHQPNATLPFWKGAFTTKFPDPTRLANAISDQLRKDGVLH